MSKLIVVIGATGGQGGSVARYFMHQGGFKVRGITRNPDSIKSQGLVKEGIEMVKANLDDEGSLKQAFEGANYVFSVTDYYETFFQHEKFYAIEKEFEQGCNIARAAAQTPTLERYMRSTLPHTSKLTGGKAIVPHFEGKGRVDSYMRLHLPELTKKTTFLIFGIFTDNLVLYPEFKPVWITAAKIWAQFYPTDRSAPYSSLGDHKINTGIFVHGLISNQSLAGKYVKCVVEEMTLEESMEAWGRASGKAPGLGSTKIISLDPQQYIDLFGKMGEEQTSQWIFFEYLSKNISPERLPELLNGLDYLSQRHKDELVNTEDSWRAMDWSAYVETHQ